MHVVHVVSARRNTRDQRSYLAFEKSFRNTFWCLTFFFGRNKNYKTSSSNRNISSAVSEKRCFITRPYQITEFASRFINRNHNRHIITQNFLEYNRSMYLLKGLRITELRGTFYWQLLTSSTCRCVINGR